MPRSKASIEKQKAIMKAKRNGQAVCDVQGAVIYLRSIRARMVGDIARGALKYPNADHVDALNALRCLQGRG